MLYILSFTQNLDTIHGQIFFDHEFDQEHNFTCSNETEERRVWQIE
jgi:hypothetical protein